jgi:hypothetical protein
LAGDTHDLQLATKDVYEAKILFFLSTIILGSNSLGQNIDICLWPLIDELKYLWSSKTSVYDVSRKYNFLTKTTLMWTINNFSSYEMVSGWSTHVKLACPYCMENNKIFTLINDGETFFLLPLAVLANRSQVQKEQEGFLYWQS